VSKFRKSCDASGVTRKRSSRVGEPERSLSEESGKYGRPAAIHRLARAPLRASSASKVAVQ
jgi:hypothetical protein